VGNARVGAAGASQYQGAHHPITRPPGREQVDGWMHAPQVTHRKRRHVFGRKARKHDTVVAASADLAVNEPRRQFEIALNDVKNRRQGAPPYGETAPGRDRGQPKPEQ
jgi:hypothetical protein